jgi:hypothetical protein
MKPSSKPQCPNHAVALEGCGFPLPKKGVGMCPVSGAEFEFEVDVNETEVVQDKFGNLIKKPKWNLTGEEL